MNPFKRPYRIAAAGAACSSAAGLVAAAAVSGLLRRRTRRSLSPRVLAAGAAAAAAAFAILYYPPYCRKRQTRSEVYLTFDDGPDVEATPQILDALAAHGARATFFMLGENAARFPGIVRRIAEEGHSLGVHGFRHDGVTLQTTSRIGRDLDDALEAVLAGAPGASIPFYRPPYGLRGPGLAAALRRRGLRVVLWTLDSHDYLTRSPGLIPGRLRTSLRPGDIVLLHDAGETGKAVADALPQVLDAIQRVGWTCAALTPF